MGGIGSGKSSRARPGRTNIADVSPPLRVGGVYSSKLWRDLRVIRAFSAVGTSLAEAHFTSLGDRKLERTQSVPKDIKFEHDHVEPYGRYCDKCLATELRGGT